MIAVGKHGIDRIHHHHHNCHYLIIIVVGGGVGVGVMLVEILGFIGE